MRTITHRYEDPLDRVWLHAAASIGLRVRRSEEAYAASDGDGGLVIGAGATLDADDCLAQMILHELCHSLVEGPESFERPDWGLDNQSARHLDRERACLRAQAYLTSRYGLRRVLAPTTEHRAFYDALPADPLDGDRPSVTFARRAVARADRDPWAPHLGEALSATAAIAQVTARAVGRRERSLWAQLDAPRPAHPAGGWVHPVPERGRCGGCAWAAEGRCAARGAPVEANWVACERYIGALRCGDCGACCREAYDRVELEPGDPFAAAHPEMVEQRGGRSVLLRVAGRCPSLEGDGEEAPYRCRFYGERPRSCRDFAEGSANCFEARRRVGLSS